MFYLTFANNLLMLSFVVVFVVFTWAPCHICQYLACFHSANLFSVFVCVKLQIHSAPCLLWSGGFLYINKDVNCINPSLNTCCVVISRGADILFVIAGMKLGVYCSFSTIHTWQFTVFFFSTIFARYCIIFTFLLPCSSVLQEHHLNCQRSLNYGGSWPFSLPIYGLTVIRCG